MTQGPKTRSVLITLAARWLAMPLSIVSGAVIARLLGPEGRGLVAWVILVPSFAASLSSLGLASSVTYLSRTGTCSLSAVTSTAVLGALALGTSASALVAGLLWLGWLPDNGASPAVTGMMLASVPMILASLFLRGALVTNDQFGSYNTLMVLGGVMPPIASILLVAGLGLGVFGAVLAVVTWQALDVLASTVVLRRGGVSIFQPDPSIVRPALQYGLRSHVGSIAQKLNLRLDQFLLGAVFSVSSLGLYTVAVRLAGLLSLLPDAIGVVLFPSIAGANRDWAAQTTAWLLRLTLVAGLLMASVLALTAEFLIVLIYGEAFRASVAPFLVALPGTLFLSLAKVATKFIDGTGRPEISSGCTTAGLVVGGLCLVPFTQTWGLAGAAAAAGLGYATLGLGAILAFRYLADLSVLDCLLPRTQDFRTAGARLKGELDSFIKRGSAA